MKNNLPYPDNLWVAVFGDDQPVPPDAAETLEILINEDDRPHVQQILELRFKEGKTINEVGEIVGRSGNRVRQIISDTGRKMRHPYKSRLPHSTIKYGIEASMRITRGETKVCYECGKLIEMNDSIYLVPSDDTIARIGHDFSNTLKICCSEECAKQSVEADVERQNKKLKLLTEEKAAREAEIIRLEAYQPMPLSMSEGQEKIREEGLTIMTRRSL